jgi:hypothetical protein
MPFLTPAMAFLLTVAFGLWLSRRGKPYNGLLFNFHKLIALGAVIVTALEMYSALQGAALQSGLVALLGVAALGIIVLFISGALLSLDKLGYAAMRATHRVAFGLAAIGLGGALWVLFV